jgi:seryl-tRNA synthetase
VRIQGEISEKKKNDKFQSKVELRDEIKELKDQNQNLQRQVELLSKSLDTAEKTSQQVEQQLQSGNYLPDNIRMAVVRGVFPNERSISLRTGRKTMSLSMNSLSTIPSVG